MLNLDLVKKIIALDLTKKKVTTENGHCFFGDFIFGADGALSWTRRFLSGQGAVQPDWKYDMATTLEIFVPNQQITGLSDYPEIYFGHIPWGYAWNFPGDRHRIIGMASLKRKSGKLIKDCFNTFLTKLQISKRNMPPPKSSALPYGNYLTRPGYGNVLLLGDACGLADPLLGEGIYYAHKSALLAAKAVLRANPDSQEALNIYTHDLCREVIAELKYIRLARQILFSLPGNWAYRVLSSFLRVIPRCCEETIQGQRSYKWFRPNK